MSNFVEGTLYDVVIITSTNCVAYLWGSDTLPKNVMISCTLLNIYTCVYSYGEKEKQRKEINSV